MDSIRGCVLLKRNEIFVLQIDFLKCNSLDQVLHTNYRDVWLTMASLTNAYLSLMNKTPALTAVFKLTFALSVLIWRGFFSSGMSFPREFC